MHHLMSAEASDPLEADSLLHIVESKFEFLECKEYQQTLYTAQQLCGSTNAWWVNYTATL
jgi:hypothetical protein